MEKIFEKIESKLTNMIEEFEKNPIKTTIKVAITIYIVKKIWEWLKENK